MARRGRNPYSKWQASNLPLHILRGYPLSTCIQYNLSTSKDSLLH